MSQLDRPWPWAKDAAGQLYRVGDLVVTTKRCWFGPGLVGEVLAITLGSVDVSTSLTEVGKLTVRPYHVLVQERRTGLRVRLRSVRKQVSEKRKQ